MLPSSQSGEYGFAANRIMTTLYVVGLIATFVIGWGFGSVAVSLLCTEIGERWGMKVPIIAAPIGGFLVSMVLSHWLNCAIEVIHVPITCDWLGF